VPGPWGPWLTMDEYKGYARIDSADTTDDAAISESVNASMEVIQLRAPGGFVLDEADQPVPVPDAIHLAGLMLVNRLMSRRNSPDGVVGVADMGTATVLSYDADINALISGKTGVVVA
jgi:hypothetical protein